MKRLLIRILPVVIALVAGAVVGALFFGGGDPHAHEHEHAHEHDNGAGASTAETWTCSMHPQVQAPKPGQCPICAMDLIPLSELGGAGEGRQFSMSEEARALAEITTTEVVRRYPTAKVRLYGAVRYDETLQETIAARFPGRIERLFVDYAGIRVNEGEHLATIYSPDLLSAQSELLTARRFDNEDALRVARDKLRLWGFSKERIREIESSGETSDELMIDAPASGIVTRKHVQQGDYVETGTPLFRINHLRELWVVFEAYESDKPWLRYGQPIAFTAEARPGRTFEGKISFVAPELDPETRTFEVRVNFENPEELLKPGMFVRGVVEAQVAGEGRVIDPSLAGKWISPMHPEIVKDGPGTCDICGMDLVPAEELGYTVAEPEGEGPLVIPASAVLHTGKRSVVYVEDPDAEEPTYAGREILLGPRADDHYLVEAGLEQGERVVSEGAFVIDSALQIQAQPSMMQPPEEPEPLYESFEASDDFLGSLDTVVKRYFDVQLALANDEHEAAVEAAAELKTSLEFDLSPLEAEAEKAFRDLRERMTGAADEVAEAADIEGARAAFETRSESAAELVRRFGTGDVQVFVAHCPMAFSNRGADWLQGNEDILNPYFGDTMLRCGEIREQLAGEAEPASKQQSASESESISGSGSKTENDAGGNE